MEWSIEKIRLNLKYTWKISRNSSAYKENFIITCRLGGHAGQAEIAPNIRYNETPENIESSFESIKNELQSLNNDYAAVLKFLHETITQILNYQNLKIF